jgi:hypothetical protein
MSDNAQAEVSDVLAVRELATLVHHLADELAGFRRRALTAEARLKEVESHDGGALNLDLAKRVAELERDNERLQGKLDAASDRARAILDRVRFLRQQTQAASPVAGGDR